MRAQYPLPHPPPPPPWDALYLGVGGGGGLPRWLRHNLVNAVSSLSSSKMEISEPDFFFDILTTYNDEISHVKHVLDALYVF